MRYCSIEGCQHASTATKRGGKRRKVESTSNDSNVSMFRIPKDPIEREKWISAIPTEKLIVTDKTLICSEHWPINFETTMRYGKICPKNPPSKWELDELTLSGEVNEIGELKSFHDEDKITYSYRFEDIHVVQHE